MKYFKDIEIFYEVFHIISKYCPISNSNVDTAITDMNNIEISSDFDSSNEAYNINNINNSNNTVNNSRNSNSENYNIITSNLVNSSISENRVNLSNFLNNECVNIYMTWYRLYNFLLGGRDADIIDLNYKKERDILFKNQFISGDYSKTPFLLRSAALFTEIMPLASTRHGLLFRKYNSKLTRNVNSENTVK